MLGTGTGGWNRGILYGGRCGEGSRYAGPKTVAPLSGFLSREVRGEAAREVCCIEGLVPRRLLLEIGVRE